MVHIDEGLLQAYLDDEVAPAERAAVRSHLDLCTVCTASFDDLRNLSAEVHAALTAVDIAAPVTRARQRLAAHGPTFDVRFADARRRERVPAGTAVGRLLRSGMLKAAMLVLALAGAASAAIPGSPVREWLRSAFGGRAANPTPAPAAVSEPAPPAPATEGGFSFAPEDGRVHVLLDAVPADARIVIRLVDGRQANIRATRQRANAGYRTGTGRVEASGLAGNITVEIPRGAVSAAIEVNGQLYAVKEGSRLRAVVPAAESAGSDLVFHGPPR